MNNINICAFIALSSMFVVACYAAGIIDYSAPKPITDRCLHIRDLVKREECYRESMHESLGIN